MKRLVYIFTLPLLLLATSCSTTKNTALSRGFHEMKTDYNVYFNGRISYEEGLQAINKANKDDFSEIINLYPISNKESQNAATSQMDKSIEKSRKCIKLHSIHAKPKRDPKRMHDPKYKAWLQQDEFNSKMYKAWLMLAQSEFHKGDFLGSIGTFSYVSRLYKYDKDMVAVCNLWIARAYAEMGWQYEAEDVLQKVKIDDLKFKNRPLYSAVSAVVLMKAGNYKDAVPYIKSAKKNEKKRIYRPRFEYVSGQIYEREGATEAARTAYKRVMDMQPEPNLLFNANLRYYTLAGDTTKTVKKLLGMTRLPKNKDLLDQLYTAIGDLYLNNGDTLKAADYYVQAAEKSTRNGSDKAAALLKAGDIYYNIAAYEKAAPCYTQAVQIIPNTDERYDVASSRAESLGQLVKELETVSLQDSLQYLSTLTEDEQREIAERIVAALIESERADSVKAQEAAREAELKGGGPRGVDTDLMFGSNRDQSWYFYNDNLLKKGRQDFSTRWGNRPLEDNWRRRSKTAQNLPATTTADNNDNADGTDGETDSETEQQAEMAENTEPVAAPETDTHKPEYYLQQIPRTEADIALSDSLIADALYNLVGIYRDRLSDLPASDGSYEDFSRRFSADERRVELLYRQYLAARREGNNDLAEKYYDELLRLYPDSEQARIVSDPAYVARLASASREQDSLYQATYNAYKKGDYKTVKANKEYMQSEHPSASLMPRFMFLNSIGIARTQGQKPFAEALKELVQAYPEHELSAMAKTMLALMGEGMEAQKGGTTAGLQNSREEQAAEQAQEDETESTGGFKTERETPSYVLVITADNEQIRNNLLYEIAVFNFSQFLIRDFDLQAISNISDGQSGIQIGGLGNMDEAEWYIGILSQDEQIKAVLQDYQAVVLPITADNYKVLNKHSIDEYREFILQHPQD